MVKHFVPNAAFSFHVFEFGGIYYKFLFKLYLILGGFYCNRYQIPTVGIIDTASLFWSFYLYKLLGIGDIGDKWMDS